MSADRSGATRDLKQAMSSIADNPTCGDRCSNVSFDRLRAAMSGQVGAATVLATAKTVAWATAPSSPGLAAGGGPTLALVHDQQPSFRWRK